MRERVWPHPLRRSFAGAIKALSVMNLAYVMWTALGAVPAQREAVLQCLSGFYRSFGFHDVFTCNFTDFGCRFVAADRSI